MKFDKCAKCRYKKRPQYSFPCSKCEKDKQCEYDLQLKREAQAKSERVHGRAEFVRLFGKNYSE